MSASYQAIGWNRQKKIYDGLMLGLCMLYLLVFIIGNLIVNPEITEETLIIRAFGTLALLLLHIILVIGPLTRLSPVFLPLLYNRRHLGVTMFCIAAIHGVFSIIQFHALGNVNPILSVFSSNTHYSSYTKFPFETVGFVALVILFLMAITSHDFWLHNLGPKVWKALHMMVYLAYTLIILHVLLGAIQFETSSMLVIILGTGMVLVIALHIAASSIEYKTDKIYNALKKDGFVMACSVDDIKEKHAKVICLETERIAIFKYDNKLSAISNVCKHQNGPLGEGRVIDGCVTCPWHGYQYLPNNGCSPPPFKEKVSTYKLKLIDREVWINPSACPEGTELEPITITTIQ